MRILLNVLNHIPCARIYAIADEGEDGYKGKRHIMFWHRDDTVALLYIEPPELHDNDTYLTFDSEIPFAEFCEILEQSEYNDRTKYSLIWHNCAYGSAFALNAAGIGIEIPNYFTFNRIGDRFFQRTPTFGMTPLDLYYIAKQHKLQLLKNQAAENAYELAKHNLLKRAEDSTQLKASKHALAIVAADEKAKNAHPEHISMHIEMLAIAADLMLQPTKDKYSEFRGLLGYHKSRGALPWTGAHLPLFMNILLAVFILEQTVKIILDHAGILPENGEFNGARLALTIVSSALAGFAVPGLMKLASDNMEKHISTYEANDLTRAMMKLLNYEPPGEAKQAVLKYK